MASYTAKSQKSVIFSASIMKFLNSDTLKLDPDQHMTFAYPGIDSKKLFRRVKRVTQRFDTAILHVGSNDCTQGLICHCSQANWRRNRTRRTLDGNPESPALAELTVEQIFKRIKVRKNIFKV
jgi:hypothetical protein